ncbi:MAG: GspE/PulE family protein [Oligoflexales bacterium]
MKFGEFVLSKKTINQDQLKTVLKVIPYRKRKIGRLMVELGFLKQKSLDCLLMQYFRPKCPYGIKELKELCNPRNLTFGALRIECASNNFIEYITTEFSDTLIEKLEKRHARDVRIYQVSESIMLLLLGKESPDKKSNQIVVSSELNPDEKIQEIDPFSKLIAQCLKEASTSRCSDIHFEPFEDCYIIRFRIHGQLHDWKTISKEHLEPLTNKLKWILGLDLAIVSQPQDSRASFATLGCDMRVNSIPTTSGSEKIVVRIQYQDQSLSLQQIGLDPNKIAILKKNIQKHNGLIVISGPTGSGKTTTLYALLEEMDRQGKNISTLENPVEKKLERIVQSNISCEGDFHSFQRALMRQDPDVILLGEIRDPETADLSMKLASTGHLVLSTVHANGAKEVIDRLINLGVDQFSIETNLRLSVAQRLLRKICPHCRISLDFGYKVNPMGCKQCKGGVIGRIAIIEYLEKEDIISKNKSTTLALEAEKLVKKGIIDFSELASFA